MLSKAASSTIFWYDDLGLNLGLPDHWRTLYSLKRTNMVQKLTEDEFRDGFVCANNWLTDSNGMSTRLGIAYAKRLGNHVHWIFLSFCGNFFLFMGLWNTDNFQTNREIPLRSGTGSNVNDVVLHTLQKSGVLVV